MKGRMARRFLMGNEAFAHAALAAGCGLFAGYPGTPSSEVIETVARLHQDGVAKGIHVEWSTNEKAALEVAAASSLSGVRSMVTCKQVGLNVASDALMSLNYLGVKGGLVLLVADDPGPISSQTEQDTRRFAAFAKVPVLDPATPEQGARMIEEAFVLSERYQTPVIFRPTTRIDHASTFFDFPEETNANAALDGGFQRDPEEYVIFPPRAYQAHGEINERLRAMAFDYTFTPELADFNQLFVNAGAGALVRVPAQEQVEANLPPARVGIVCGGVSTQYAQEALRLLRQQLTTLGQELPAVRLLQIGTPYPFPHRTASRALKDLTDVLVLEELDSVIEEELQKMASTSFLWPRIHGKLTDEANARGENSTEDALARIVAFFAKSGIVLEGATSAEIPEEDASGSTDASVASDASVQLGHDPGIFQYSGNLPPRPAVLCAGCPHRASFLAVKRALKQLDIARDDAVFCGDIGCYTLGNATPLDAVDTCLCMGGGITMAQGIAAVNPQKKAIAFVGDSTFFASGVTGVVNAAYNDHDVTICVLDNSTTAMTGMQPHPGTGVRLMGGASEPTSIKAMLEASNITKIVEVDPLEPESAEESVMDALSFEGPSAVIFQSPCVWKKPFGIPAKVSTSQCTGCKKCVTQIGCPAIGFDPEQRGSKSGRRGQAVIDRSQCNGCSLCLSVCPAQAISLIPEVEPKPVRQSRLNRGGTAATLGEPVDERLREEERDEDAAPVEGENPEEAVLDDGAQEPFDLQSEEFAELASPLYGYDEDFEDDDLYDDMIGASSEGPSAAGRGLRRIRQRRYFMKEPAQRGRLASRFVKTAAGEASQATQIELTTGRAVFAWEAQVQMADVPVEEDAASDEPLEEATAPSKPSPDYGGGSELKLSDLLGNSDINLPEEGFPDKPKKRKPTKRRPSVPIADEDPAGQVHTSQEDHHGEEDLPHEPETGASSAQDVSTSASLNEYSDQDQLSADLSFDSVQVRLVEEERQRPSRRLRRVHHEPAETQHPAGTAPAQSRMQSRIEYGELPETHQRSFQSEVRPLDPKSTPARPQAPDASRSVRSKFADYGKIKGSSSTPRPFDPGRGERR